jgi:hypothetical protein
VIGTLDHPHAAIVFGEKGAGKTALRLLIGKKVAQHNQEKPKRRVLLVPYDDMNPVLDLVARHRGGPGADALMKGFRLPDHQDAMLRLPGEALRPVVGLGMRRAAAADKRPAEAAAARAARGGGARGALRLPRGGRAGRFGDPAALA